MNGSAYTFKLQTEKTTTNKFAFSLLGYLPL